MATRWQCNDVTIPCRGFQADPWYESIGDGDYRERGPAVGFLAGFYWPQAVFAGGNPAGGSSGRKPAAPVLTSEGNLYRTLIGPTSGAEFNEATGPHNT